MKRMNWNVMDYEINGLSLKNRLKAYSLVVLLMSNLMGAFTGSSLGRELSERKFRENCNKWYDKAYIKMITPGLKFGYLFYDSCHEQEGEGK